MTYKAILEYKPIAKNDFDDLNKKIGSFLNALRQKGGLEKLPLHHKEQLIEIANYFAERPKTRITQTEINGLNQACGMNTGTTDHWTRSVIYIDGRRYMGAKVAIESSISNDVYFGAFVNTGQAYYVALDKPEQSSHDRYYQLRRDAYHWHTFMSFIEVLQFLETEIRRIGAPSDDYKER